MNDVMYSWFLPRASLELMAAPHHAMDELVWACAGSGNRSLRRVISALVVYGADDEPIVPREPHILPTSADVPVPEPFDVPEPIETPPPEPSDVPSPKPRPVP